MLILTLLASVQLAQVPHQKPLNIASGAADSNDVPLHNGMDVMFVHSSPSVGFPTGTFPPDLTGDLFWKVLTGDRILAHHRAFPGTAEIDGYLESIYDTDWQASPDFYDRMQGPAIPDFFGTCNLQPSFFQAGALTGAEVFVSLGNSGLPDPCIINPNLCTPPGPGNCPPAGFVNGYSVDISFPGGVILPADGTAASDTATTYFVTGGMTFTGGTCGLGDYGLQAAYSTDETPFDDCLGVSEFSGYQIAASGPIPDPFDHTPTNNLTFREPMLNVRAESVVPGIQTSNNGGGALNALKVDRLPLAGATLVFEVRDQGTGTGPNTAFVLYSLTPVGPPGVPFAGAFLLMPFPLGSFAIPCLPGPVVTPAVGPEFAAGTTEGAYVSCPIPVALGIPPFGTDVYFQGITVTSFAPLTLTNTNRVRMTLY